MKQIVASLRGEIGRMSRRLEQQEALQVKTESKVRGLKDKVKTLRREVKSLQYTDIRREQMAATSSFLAGAAGGGLGGQSNTPGSHRVRRRLWRGR